MRTFLPHELDELEKKESVDRETLRSLIAMARGFDEETERQRLVAYDRGYRDGFRRDE